MIFVLLNPYGVTQKAFRAIRAQRTDLYVVPNWIREISYQRKKIIDIDYYIIH